MRKYTIVMAFRLILLLLKQLIIVLFLALPSYSQVSIAQKDSILAVAQKQSPNNFIKVICTDYLKLAEHKVKKQDSLPNT